MPYTMLDREKIRFHSLSERPNKVEIERDHVPPGRRPGPLTPETEEAVRQAAEDVRRAMENGRPVMLAFGAHAIKNGLAPVMIDLMEKGCLTHLATNGAGIIHDWEFAFQGASSEDVQANVAEGRFGIWEETGFYINLALCVGAWLGLGYGESVGALVEEQGLLIPDPGKLAEAAARCMAANDCDRAAAAMDLCGRINRFGLKPGFMSVPHPFRRYSVQAAAHRLGIPFTGHPMFGHDIIYTHPMNHGASIGRCAERDFLTYAHCVSELSGGVYLSIGSAVMSPMIFEKSLSMARNIVGQKRKRIEDFNIYVVDLGKSSWDWRKGEPPTNDPAYYMRHLKTFNRMGGTMRYVSADNRDFLLLLGRVLLIDS